MNRQIKQAKLETLEAIIKEVEGIQESKKYKAMVEMGDLSFHEGIYQRMVVRDARPIEMGFSNNVSPIYTRR